MPSSEQWFYRDAAGHQAGPVSAGDLEGLRARGTITPATLVWQKDMPGWQTMHAIDPNLPETRPCAECNTPHPSSELLQYGNVPICVECKSAVVNKLQLGGRIGQGLWQDGKFIIAENHKVLPARCFKCNEPALASYHKKLSWVPAWPGFMFIACILAAAVLDSPHPFFAGLIAYLVANRIIGKNSQITVYLCHAHAKKRLIAYVTQAISAIVAPLALVAGSLAFSQKISEPLSGLLLCLGAVALIALIIANRITSGLVTLKSVEDGLSYFRGAGHEFLSSLPDWYRTR